MFMCPKAVLNKKVLRRLLKVLIEHVVVFSSDGSRFQARGQRLRTPCHRLITHFINQHQN